MIIKDHKCLEILKKLPKIMITNGKIGSKHTINYMVIPSFKILKNY